MYTAEEIPLGAILLSNAMAGIAADKVQGFKPRFQRKLQYIKGIFCKLFTGLPTTHSIAALGQGQFLHVDDGKDVDDKPSDKKSKGLCSGRPILEDHSDAKRAEEGRKGKKYMFGYEIVVINKEKVAQKLDTSVEDVNVRLERWKNHLLEARKNKPSSSMIDIISTIFNTRRPKNYDITTVFNSNNCYSCSGLICTALAAENIDVMKSKRVNKVTPSDFFRSNIYDLAYSNNRSLFESVKEQ